MSVGTATYVTTTDKGYFLGTVGLVNSLRLTGNHEPVVVVDVGLTKSQRDLLSHTCDVRSPPVTLEDQLAVFFKASIGRLGVNGTIVLVDSDIIVTSQLGDTLAKASAGQICAFVDEPVRDRQFEEWHTTLGLRAPLRVQPYVNAGFLALDTDRWATLLERWWGLTLQISEERSKFPQAAENRFTMAFGLVDQDVLNALLMSEAPPGATWFMDGRLASTPVENRSTRVLDRTRLRCVNGPVETVLLHHLWHPKPWWRPAAATRLSFDAYVDLLARVLTADDVSIRVDPNDLPLWLRDGAGGRAARETLYHSGQAARRILDHLPDHAARAVRRVARAVVSPEHKT